MRGPIFGAAVLLVLWACSAAGQETSIAGLLSGNDTTGTSPSASPVPPKSPGISPPAASPPPTLNQPPPAVWTSPIPPNLAVQSPPAQGLLPFPPVATLTTPPPASPAVAALSPPAAVLLSPPPAAAAAPILLSPPPAPVVSVVLSPPPAPVIPAILSPPPVPIVSSPPPTPVLSPPPTPNAAATQLAPAPALGSSAALQPPAAPLAASPADSGSANSTLAFVLHLEGAAVWPFNATQQARLVTALQSALPGIPAANFSLTNAVQAQPTQATGRRLLQAATAADVSGQVSTASPAAASAAQTALQAAVNTGSLQSAFNKQGGPSATAVTLSSSAQAAAVPAGGCSGGTLVNGVCLGSTDNTGSSGLPTWAIVVIVVAGTALLFSLLMLALCCFLLRRKTRRLTPKLKEASKAHSPRKLFTNPRAVQPSGEPQQQPPNKSPAAAAAVPAAAGAASVPSAAAAGAAVIPPAAQPAPARPAVAAAAPAAAQGPGKPVPALSPRELAKAHTRSAGPNEPSPPRRTSGSRTTTRHHHESTTRTEYALSALNSSPENHPGRSWQAASSASSLGRTRSGSVVSVGSEGSAASPIPGVERTPSLPGSAASGPSRIQASNQRSSQFASALAPKHANRALAALAKRHAARMSRTLIPGPLSQAFMNKRSILGGMYKLEAGRTFADSRIVAQGVVMDSQRKVTAELFVHPTDFHNARRFANAVHARPCIPDVLDTFDAGEADNKPGSSTPAALVHAGADFTLGDLLSDDLAGLSPPGRKQCVLHLLEALNLLHSQGIVHRSLRPDNLLFYEPDQRWRIFGMARWARSGTDAPLLYNLRYAGPEVVKADLMATAVRDRALQGRHSTIDADAPVNGVADPASDMWAAGAIAWHVFTGRPLFEGPLTDSDILGMLLGIRPLPFEEDPTLWVLFSHHQAAHLVQGLLSRRPEERLTAQAALAMAEQL